MVKDRTSSLIDYVQSVVSPGDRMPSDPTSESDNDLGATDGSRAKIPEWLTNEEAERLEVPHGSDVLIDPEALGDLDVTKLTNEGKANPMPETYAYYLPFHYYSHRWGIYIKASGVFTVAAAIRDAKSISDLDSLTVRAAFQMLLQHEGFHHKAELACSRFEIPSIEILRSLGCPGSLYDWYFADVDGAEHEEAMANAHAINALSDYFSTLGVQSIRTRLLLVMVAKFMQSQPAGYRDFADWENRPKFKEGLDQIIKHVSECCHTRLIARNPGPQVKGRSYFQESKLETCPVYLVRDKFSQALGIGKPFPVDFGAKVIVHTREHLPPHFHLEMPVGVEVGRYTWPGLEPLPGEKALSRKQGKTLDRYFQKYGKEVEEKISAVYTGMPPS